MTSFNRVDHAVLLLKERLRKLSENKGRRASGAASSATRTESDNRLTPIRQLKRQRDIGDQELRRALVRALLADSLGEELTTSLGFQAVADEVVRLIEASDGGRDLLERALAEMG